MRPVEPGRVVALTLLSLIVSLLSVQGAGGQTSILRPPELTTALRNELVAVAALPKIPLVRRRLVGPSDGLEPSTPSL